MDKIFQAKLDKILDYDFYFLHIDTLTLSLFVARINANHINPTFPFNGFAVYTSFFNARLYFHFNIYIRSGLWQDRMVSFRF